MNKTLITIVSLGVIFLVAFAVVFSRCNAIPEDHSQAVLDSVVKASKIREDSLQSVIDSTRINAEAARIEANKFDELADAQHQAAAQVRAKYAGLKAEYDRMKDSSQCREIVAACDETIEAAGRTILHLDSTILLKDKSIELYKRSIDYEKTRANALSLSREGLKRDFMKLQTDVIPPLQVSLRQETKQHKANRFWKKTFAGGLAIAIIYGAVQTFNH